MSEAYLKLPTSFAGVIFDCDGVIINSREANTLYYNKVLSALGLPAQTKEQEAYTHMSTVREAFLHIVPEELLPKVPEILKSSVDYFRDIMPLVKLEEGFLDFVTWLKANKIKLAVHTNRYDGMPVVLDTFKLHGIFDPIITAADVTPKPSPEGIFKILDMWQLKNNSVFFVGDSSNDQAAAKGGDVPFIAFANPRLDAAVNVDTFAELKSFLTSKYIGA